MPKSAVADAFETKVGNPWNGLPVEGFDEVLADPPTSTNGFIAVQFPIVSGSSPVLASRKFEDGSARFVLNIKKEVGLRQARLWADGLADLLRRTKFGGVETFDPDGPIETDNNDDGVYIALAVVIPYRYQFDA
jgi:hypothetical protein